LSRQALETTAKDANIQPRARVREARAALVEHFKGDATLIHPAALFAPDPKDIADLILHADHTGAGVEDAADVVDSEQIEGDADHGVALFDGGGLDDDAGTLDDHETAYGIAAEWFGPFSTIPLTAAGPSGGALCAKHIQPQENSMSARPNEARLSCMEGTGQQSRRQLELPEKPKRQLLLPLNLEQEAAIRDHAAKHGRRWKSILNNVWMGGAPYDDGGVLRSFEIPMARAGSSLTDCPEQRCWTKVTVTWRHRPLASAKTRNRAACLGSPFHIRLPELVTVCPSVLLRSEPAAVRFKAAVAPRGGRHPPSRAEQTRVIFARAIALLVRRSAPLVLPCPDLEAPVFRRFGVTAPKGNPARGRNRIGLKGKDMAKPATNPRQSTRVVQLRKGATVEMVRLTCPDAVQALKITESFGTAVIDSDGVRDLHERLICETADALSEGLGERAMQIHLQRIVGAFVGSAHGAGQFYSKAVTEARDATAKAANDARDEDLDGPVGYDSAAHRKREFAADMGIQAHALRMAAEGAVAAYKHVVGESWKPFDRPIESAGQSVDRKAAEAQMSAFD